MRLWAVLAAVLLSSLVLAGCSDDGGDDGDATATSSSSAQPTTTSGATTAPGTTSSSTTTPPPQTGPGSDPPNSAPRGKAEAAPGSGPKTLWTNFTLNGTDPDGDNIVWDLTFGDGTSGASGAILPAKVSHNYTANGTYQANFTISDGRLQSTYPVTITVGGVAPPPSGGGGTPPPAVDPLDALCPTDENAVALPSGHYATPMDSAADPPFSVGTVWIYEESNDRPGLQRNDDTMPTSCPNADTIIF